MFVSGLLISVPFLIFTILVYSLIPELRDLHGKSLTCHVMCLTVAYVFLAFVQLSGETLNEKLCMFVGEYQLIYSFVDNVGANGMCLQLPVNVKR
jgi:hypothetical protein